MNILKKFNSFFIDLFSTKKNYLHDSSESTFMLMRLFYRISNGLIIYLFCKFLNFNSKAPSAFKNGLLNNDSLEEEFTKKLHSDIINMPIKKDSSNFTEKIKLHEQKIDFDYYKKNRIVRILISGNSLLRNRHVAMYATNSKWISICENILGTKPYLVALSAWVTLPYPDQINNYDEVGNIESSQMWHRDCDYLRDIKIMTYLTDVHTDEDGPFEIIKDTHSFSFFNPFNYEMGMAMRVKNNYVNKYLINKKHSFVGKKGSTFTVDTRALHRGKTIAKPNHYRLTLQLYFTNSLFGNRKRFPLPDKSWDSYDIWNKSINKSDSYRTLFI
jgi:hypothetical protein